ncbi:polyketide cyclase [Arthrobacter sp. ERGS1:01]|uniref:nuclear transport factor 2 family protein n=1 Tax=Arthrobacter sp. ERGS1:01 TaxID=1704044 RepID=UPI0006B61AE3|nr:nuclear transport factor 2 family protein [Arthrobacter sp. ERGS1:01]ALE04943.1 polyketide cyclase [Arthrobacter sp. ERGS1:01]
MTLTTDDRLAIHELLSLHGHLMDSGDLDHLDQLFTLDVVYDLSPLGAGMLHGIDAIRRAAQQLGDKNPVAHHVTNVVIGQGEGKVTARSKGIGIRADGSVGSVVYDDELQQTPNGWRISRRRISPRREPLTP